MKYNINLVVEVDPDANWLETGDTENLDSVMDTIKNCIYDLDDLRLDYIEVELYDG